MRALGLALLLGVVPAGQAGAEGLAHAHYVGLLTGVVDNGGLNETAPTIGASYRYRVAERLAIGLEGFPNCPNWLSVADPHQGLLMLRLALRPRRRCATRL